MLKGKKTVRIIASFFLLVILNNLLFPTVAWALTSGPASPDASSFEPIDTTDMVNLSSGDFVYNIPLLEVPGPSGGYPINMAYHAGIMPNEDASWVGLGWSLNTGAINRSVNGYADDHNGLINTKRDWWVGGNTSTFKIGVNYGITGTPASVSAGLSISNDTYAGVGVGGFVGLGFKFTDGVGLSAEVGTDGVGNSYASANLGIRFKGADSGMGASIGVSTNFRSTSASAGISNGPISSSVSYSKGGLSTSAGFSTGLIDASISSNGGRFTSNISIGGSSVQNGKAGNISTSSSGFNIPIPTPVPGLAITLGYSNLRYWSDEKSNVYTFGSLYNKNNSFDGNVTAFDSYNLKDIDNINFGSDDAKTENGLMFPAYDNYNIMAQGVFGSIRPYQFKNYLHLQTVSNGDYKVQDNYLSLNSQPYAKVGFRFVNDFSGFYKFDGEDLDLPTAMGPFRYSYPDDEVIGGHFSNGRLAGSKHIEYYTNAQIITGEASQLMKPDNYTKGFARLNNDQIGGFVITNESGVSFHFALPVYNNFQKSIGRDVSGGKTGSDFENNNKYAYTWHITAITGPDFVDAGSVIGEVDDQDYGYWIRFEYGKWTSDFGWRNPSEGFNTDLDQNFKNYSYGTKEVFYLNAVRSATHTALFVKELRADGKSVIGEGGGFYEKQVSPYESCTKNCDDNRIEYCGENFTCEDCYECETCMTENNCDVLSKNPTYLLPVSSLKLKKIILVNNKDLALSTYNNLYSKGSGDTYHLWNNILDIKDLTTDGNVLSSITDKTIREIVLTHDYSLTPDTPNSFDEIGAIYNTTTVATANIQKRGKLALKELKFNGKHAFSIIPSIKFGYEIESSIYNNLNIDVITNYYNLQQHNFPSQYSLDISILNTVERDKFQLGNLVQFEKNGVIHYALVAYKSTDRATLVPLDGVKPSSNGIISSLKFTKNPPYNKENFDLWGMYKSDYINSIDENIKNINADRRTSSLSEKSVDAWSMRQIQTSTGSRINVSYESNSYGTPVLHQPYILTVKGASKVAQETNTIRFSFLEDKNNLEELFTKSIDDEVTFIIGMTQDVQLKDPDLIQTWFSVSYYKEFTMPLSELVITPNEVKVTNQSMKDFMYNIYPEWANVPSDFNFKSPRLTCGNLKFSALRENYGSGIRVSKIINSTADNIKEIATYTYEKNGYTSGITSYEPNSLDRVYLIYGTVVEGNHIYHFLKDHYLNALFKDFSKLLSISSEIPAPGVVYEFVRVSRSIENKDGTVNIEGSVEYQFEPFNKGMIGVVAGTTDINNSSPSSSGWYNASNVNIKKVSYKKRTIKNFSSRIGNLKRIVMYDGNNNKINEIINTYLHDGSGKEFKENIDNYETKVESNRIGNQGTIAEVFVNGRVFLRMGGNGEYYSGTQYGIMSRREEYPSIATGQTTIDYKLGVKKTTTNLKYNILSGLPTEVLSEDAYGAKILTRTVPAHTKYNEMRSGLLGGANMLVQSAAEYSLKVNNDYENNPINANITGLLGASAQTWMPFQNGMVKHRSYVYSSENLLSDGSMAYSSSNDFDVWDYQLIDQVSGEYPEKAGWEMTSIMTHVSPNSKALEARDINGNFAATKMDGRFHQVYASVSNGSYYESAYSGAEDALSGNYFGGGVLRGSGAKNTSRYHSGKYSLSVSGGQTGFTYSVNIPSAPPHYYYPPVYFNANKAYRTSVWVNANDNTLPNAQMIYKVNGATVRTSPAATVSKKVGNWYLLEMIIPAQQGTVSNIELSVKNNSSQTIYMDDFRFHPLEASMTSYVYDEFSGELNYILDNNNLFTQFQYNQMGNLIATYKESFQYGLKKVNEFAINYGRDNTVESLYAMNYANGACSQTNAFGGYPPYTYSWYTKAQGGPTWGAPKKVETMMEATSCYAYSGTCIDVQCVVKDKLGNEYTTYGSKCN